MTDSLSYGILEISLKTRKTKPFYHRRKTLGGDLITTNFKSSAKVMRQKDAKKLVEDYIRVYGMENINQIAFKTDI